MRYLLAPALLAVVLTGCGGSGGDGAGTSTPTFKAPPSSTSASEPTSTKPAASECEGLKDASSGRPLCEFEGLASYPARLAIANDPEALLKALQEVAPWLDEGDFSDVVSTCEEAIDRDPVVDHAVTRFSGGPDEQVSSDEAAELIKISQQFACP
jgi:hypothetical protein